MKPAIACPESKRISGSPECSSAESILFPEHLSADALQEVAGKPGGPLGQPRGIDVVARERAGPGKAPCPRSAGGCLCTARPCCSLLSAWLSGLPAATEGFMSLRFGHCSGCNRGLLWSSVSSSLMQGLSCSLDLTLFSGEPGRGFGGFVLGFPRLTWHRGTGGGDSLGCQALDALLGTECHLPVPRPAQGVPPKPLISAEHLGKAKVLRASSR